MVGYWCSKTPDSVFWRRQCYSWVLLSWVTLALKQFLLTKLLGRRAGKNGRDLIKMNSMSSEQCVCMTTFFLDQSVVHVNTQATTSALTGVLVLFPAVTWSCMLALVINGKSQISGMIIASSPEHNDYPRWTVLTRRFLWIRDCGWVRNIHGRVGLCGSLQSNASNPEWQPRLCFFSHPCLCCLRAPTTIHRSPIGLPMVFWML